MANNLELSLRINANASDAIRSLLETRRSLADLSTQTQTAQQRTAELARTQQDARQQADQLRVQHTLASRELAELGSRVSRTNPEYRALSAQVRQLAGDLRSADREATNQTGAFERSRNATAELSARMEALQQTSHRTREALRTQGVDVSRLASEYLRLRQAEQQAAAARPLIADAARISQHYQNPAEVQARQQAELNAHLAAGRINQDTYNRALADYNRQAQSGVDQTNRLGSAIRSMGHIAAAVFATHSAFNLGRAIYQTSVDFQRIEGLLKTVTGSAAAATEQLRWLDDISNKLGLDVTTTAKQYGFYAASAKEAGFSQDEVNRVFYNFTSAISGLQLGQAQAERVMYALTQMTTKPKVALEELQSQLGDSLPGVMRKAARAAGISTDELYDKISKGQLMSSEFIKAFSQVLADDFPALTEGAAQSAARLENAWVKAKLEFGKGGFTDAVAKTLDQLTASIDGQTPALKTWSAALGEVITLLSAHGEEAGIGLSALLAGMRYGPVGAVVAGGTAAVASAYVDSKKEAPDISFKSGDSADVLRERLHSTQYLLKELSHNVFLSDEEEQKSIAYLLEHKQKLLAELANATKAGNTKEAPFEFDPSKGFKKGTGDTEEQKKATKDLAQSQLETELALLSNTQQAAEAQHQHALKALANTTAAKQLTLKQQLDSQQISEQDSRDRSLALEKAKLAEELALKKQFYSESARLAVAEIDAKTKNAPSGAKFSVKTPEQAAQFEKILADNGGDLPKAQATFQQQHGGGTDLDAGKNNADKLAIEQDLQAKLAALEQEAAARQLSFAATELDNAKATAAQKEALSLEAATAAHDAAQAGLDDKISTSQQELDLGNIDQEQHLANLRRFAADRLAIEKQLLADKRALLSGDAVALAQNLNAKTAAERQAAAAVKAIDNKATLDKKAAFKAMFAPFETALDGMVQGVLTGQQTMGAAMKRAGQSLLLSYISDTAKKKTIAAAEWLWEVSGFAGKEAKKTALQNKTELGRRLLWLKEKAQLAGGWLWETLGFAGKETAKTGILATNEGVQVGVKATAETAKAGAVIIGETIKTGAVVVGTGVRDTVETVSNAKSGLGAAWRAAKSTFASVMDVVPFPLNIVMAPIAAVGAFAGVMAMGSAKGGKLSVEKDGQLFELHKEESVLPAGMAADFRQVVGIAKAHVKAGVTGDEPVLPTSPISAAIKQLTASGQLSGNWGIPASVLNGVQKSTQAAVTIALQARATEAQTHPNTQQAAVTQHINHIKEGDTINHIQATDAHSFNRMLEKSGDTLGKIGRQQAQRNRVPRSA